MINLHVIGDSHSSEVTWGGISIDGINIVCHHLGPVTCAAFGFEKYEINMDRNDWACFCFGEIDCRDHVGKHDENYKVIIDKITENYFYAVSLYDVARTYIFSVPPAVIQLTAAGDPWPCVGTDEQRKKYVAYMNQSFSRACDMWGFRFMNVHNKYADEDGYFNLQYRDHCVHIKNPVFIEQYLKAEYV